MTCSISTPWNCPGKTWKMDIDGPESPGTHTQKGRGKSWKNTFSVFYAVTVRYRKGPLSQRSAIAKDRYCHVMYKLLYPSIRSGQRLLYRSGSGLGLVLVFVCAYCSACVDLCDSGPLRYRPFCDSGPESSMQETYVCVCVCVCVCVHVF